MGDADTLALKQEIRTLRARLAELEESGHTTPSVSGDGKVAQEEAGSRGAGPVGWQGGGHSLSKKQVERYSRQLILPSFGVAGVTPCLNLQRGLRANKATPLCVSVTGGMV